MQKTMSYQLPKICCRCGEKQGVSMRLIQVSKIGDVGYFALFVLVKSSNYSFGVPVCQECAELLRKQDANTKIRRIVFCILLALGVFIFFNFGGYFSVGLIVSIPIYIVAHLIIVNQPITGDGLGGFTGNYFWFSNRKFFKQFAELNPQFVSPQHLQQLMSEPVNSGFDSTNARPGFSWTRSNKILVFAILIFITVFLIVCRLLLAGPSN